MTSSSGGMAFGAIAILMFTTGIGIPVMATLNAGLGTQIGSPAAATAILFAISAVLAAGMLLVTGTPQLADFASVRPWSYLGAIFVLYYIFSITWAAPHIGIGNAVFFVLLGQLLAAAVIDHYGLLGALRSEMTMRRAIGIAVMAVGVYLARKPR